MEDFIEPPDPWVAAGPDQVVQVVNLKVRITNRRLTGANDFALRDFFKLPSSPTTYDGDGRIVFDSLHGRWIASEFDYDCDTTQPDADFGHGFISVAVSRTANANGTWDVMSWPEPDVMLDFPSLGTSTDKVGVGTNGYLMQAESSPGAGDCISNTGFVGGAVYSWDWSQMLRIASTTTNLVPSFLPIASFESFAPRVALQAPATSSALFVVSGVGADLTDVGYATITGTNGAGSTDIAGDFDLTTSNVVSPFVQPNPPTQSGSPATIVDAVDFRPTDAAYRQGRLIVTSTTRCTPSGDTTARDCARFTELSTHAANAAATLRQDFAIGASGFDSFMPGAGYAGDGTLHLAWTRSSSSSFASSLAAYQRTTDAVNVVSTPQVVTAGTATYDGTRWGDYVGVAQDPQVPDAIWAANQYAATGGGWATTVAQLQTGGLRYVPITPIRVLDNRTGKDIGLTGKFVSSTARTFQVTGGTIPSTARAVTGNVTVVNQQAGGYVAVTPVATSTPTSSTINFPSGDVRANNLTAALGAAGKLSAVYKATTGKTTDLLFDVTGYYVDDDTKATYNPDAPVRVLDSRSTKNIGLTGRFSANVARRLPLGDVVVGSTTPVPNDAIAITANLTVVGQTQAGYLSVLTADPGAATPAVSNLNFPLGDTRANGITVPLDGASTQGIWIVYKASAGQTTDVILDVTGYFRNDGTGVEFHPLNPGRTMDTRSGKILTGLTGKFHGTVPRTLDVDGRWGVPTGATAVTGNLTVTGQTKAGYVAVTQDPAYPVSTSTLNFPLGDTRANGITVPLSTSPTGNVSMVYGASSTATTDLILDLSGYFK